MIPDDELGGVARDALLARAARGEVPSAEAQGTAEWHTALAEWRPGEEEGRLFVPLPAGLAAHVLPATVFAGLGRDPASSFRELIFIAGHERNLTAKGVVNIVGGAALLATGGGLLLYSGLFEGNTRKVVVRLRVSLDPVPGGTELELARQVDDRDPEPVTTKEKEAARDRIMCTASAMRHYLALFAVFGPWASGAPIANAPARAIEARLVSLGEPLASRAEELARKLRSSLERASTGA
jgi:hypothetical protein